MWARGWNNWASSTPTDPLGCTIMVGGPTWERLGGAFAGLSVGEVELRGKRAAIPVWRVDRAAAAGSVSPASPPPAAGAPSSASAP